MKANRSSSQLFLHYLIISFFFFSVSSLKAQQSEEQEGKENNRSEINLGSFSIGLSVADLETSITFYTKLGFTVIGGDPEGDWVMMENGVATIGLFEGMFEGNVITFNPEDVRSIQRKLKEGGVPLIVETDESTTGPAHILVSDPDGNILLFDQF